MSKKLKLTPWFPGKTNPARAGVYETKNDAADPSPDFQYWDGNFWGQVSPSPRDAYIREHVVGWFQTPKWRGLAVKP